MLDAWFAGSAAFADWLGALFALLVSADSPAFAFELLVVACPAALLEPDAWLSLTSCVASALFAVASAVEALLVLPAVELCSAVVVATLLTSPAKAKLGVRVVARAIAVSSGKGALCYAARTAGGVAHVSSFYPGRRLAGIPT